MRSPLKFLMLASTGISALGVLLLAAAMALVVIHHGHSAITWDFLSTETSGAGASGGILWQIFGTITLILTAALVAVPFATALALLHSFFLKENGVLQRTLGFGLQILNAVPSIIFGILGLLVFTRLFSGATFPTGIKDQPLLSLSYHIFVLAQDSFHESSRANLWGSALVLVTLVTLLSALAIPLRHKLYNAADHA
ncbi:hypothetical protein V2O64_25240 (plasmid) [Verrucomicrobiaceae bacterium 227]